MRTLILRADASPDIGTGHVMRCLAIGEALVARGGRSVLITNSPAPALQARAQRLGIEWVERPEISWDATGGELVARVARSIGAAWCVVDSYRSSAPFERALRAQGARVLALDDQGLGGPHDVDAVLDTVCIDNAFYALRAPGAATLLGPRFLPLRREFRDAPDPSIPPRARRVLITMGGADPSGTGLRVLRALATIGADIEVEVLVGGVDPRLSEIRSLAATMPFPSQVTADAPRVVEVFARAEVAIAAAGSTVWELCRCGVPTIAIVTAPNQAPVAEAIARASAGLWLGASADRSDEELRQELRRLLGDPAGRKVLSEHARALVDGKGADRVIAALAWHGATLAPVRADDARWIWEWANDPTVRSHSFDPRPIAWKDHEAWLARKMQDPRTRFFVARDIDGEPLGHVRFDRDDDGVAWIGVTVSPLWRGLGLGGALLSSATSKVFQGTDWSEARGKVKAQNIASRQAFLAAGFHETARGKEGDVEVVTFGRARSEGTS